MYDNIGGKIKSLAKVIFIVEAVLAVVAGIATMAVDDSMIATGFIILIVGPVVAGISSWLLYGFGELIEKVGAIERNTRGSGKSSDGQAMTDAERLVKLERLRSQDLITDEEYQQAISKTK